MLLFELHLKYCWGEFLFSPWFIQGRFPDHIHTVTHSHLKAAQHNHSLICWFLPVLLIWVSTRTRSHLQYHTFWQAGVITSPMANCFLEIRCRVIVCSLEGLSTVSIGILMIKEGAVKSRLCWENFLRPSWHELHNHGCCFLFKHRTRQLYKWIFQRPVRGCQWFLDCSKISKWQICGEFRSQRLHHD